MNDTMKTIHSLHTIHGNFSSREISESDLIAILNSCVCAASASARQSYSILVVDDKTVMKEYLHYVGSKALIFCVDFTRLIDTAKYLNHSYHCGGVLDFITGSTDTILAAQTAVIAAKSLGIDSMFTNSLHRGNSKKFYSKFKIPEGNCFPLIALILGYSTNENNVARGRLNGLGLIHYGEYHRLDEIELRDLVDDYDNVERNLGLEFFNRKTAQNFNRYLDWFYRVWCKPETEEYHNEIWEVLKNAGFLFNHES